MGVFSRDIFDKDDTSNDENADENVPFNNGVNNGFGEDGRGDMKPAAIDYADIFRDDVSSDDGELPVLEDGDLEASMHALHFY